MSDVNLYKSSRQRCYILIFGLDKNPCFRKVILHKLVRSFTLQEDEVKCKNNWVRLPEKTLDLFRFILYYCISCENRDQELDKKI